MKISAQMTLVGCVIFAVACFGAAINVFTSVGEVADAKQAADAYGFGWFWAFLGAVGAVFAAISWWMIRTHKEDA